MNTDKYCLRCNDLIGTAIDDVDVFCSKCFQAIADEAAAEVLAQRERAKAEQEREAAQQSIREAHEQPDCSEAYVQKIELHFCYCDEGHHFTGAKVNSIGGPINSKQLLEALEMAIATLKCKSIIEFPATQGSENN